MQFHLVLPGLLWPAKVLHDCARALELPALDRLLGLGRMAWAPALPLEECLCREFNMAATPVAPLRMLGEDMDPGEGVWLCADPRHLGFAQGQLILGSEHPGVSLAEMQAAIQTLTPRLARVAGYREFKAGAAGSGYAYLGLDAAPNIATTPPSLAGGLGGQFALPAGTESADWIRLGNELQMLLHAMPENRQREADRRPLLNTLWFWGAGSLPRVLPSPYATVLGDDPLMRGLARWSRAANPPLPANGDTLPISGATLACIDDLLPAIQALDVGLWREKLLDIERRWFAPLAAALRSGALESLRVTALGPEARLELRLRGRDRFRFWRGRRSLASLAAPGTNHD